MMKRYLLFLITISAINAQSICAQAFIRSLKLQESKNPELLELLNDSKFYLKISNYGNMCYILLNEKLAVIDILNRENDTIINLNFLKFGKNSKTYLLTSRNNIGIITYNMMDANKLQIPKKICFYELNPDYKVMNTSAFMLGSGSYLLEEEYSNLLNYSYINDTLVISFAQNKLWLVKDDTLIFNSAKKEPLEFQKLDIWTNLVYTVSKYVDSLNNEVRIYSRIYLGNCLILDSRNYPDSNNTELGWFNIYNDRVYINGRDYYYNIVSSEWQKMNSSLEFSVYDVFEGGFYNYSSSDQLLTLIYL